MRITNDLTKKVSEKIKDLSDNNIKEVIDFIEFLRFKKNVEEKGTPDSILKHIGVWKFKEGEMDSILEDIQKLREIED